MTESQDAGKAGSNRSATIRRIVIAVLVIAAVVFAFKVFNIQEKLQLALDWIDGLGATGPILFTFIYVLCCVFLISGAILTVGGGAVFGLLMGCVYVSLASTLGATAAFLVGRYFARDWVAKKIENNPSFRAIDEAVADEGWKIVGLTRLSPVFPFVFLNYAFGLTKVRLRDYFFASWIGMMPGTVMYVYIGSLAGDLATMGGDRARTPAEWTLYSVGLIATIVVSVFVTKIARRALSGKIDEPDASSDA